MKIEFVVAISILGSALAQVPLELRLAKNPSEETAEEGQQQSYDTGYLFETFGNDGLKLIGAKAVFDGKNKVYYFGGCSSTSGNAETEAGRLEAFQKCSSINSNVGVYDISEDSFDTIDSVGRYRHAAVKVPGTSQYLLIGGIDEDSEPAGIVFFDARDNSLNDVTLDPTDSYEGLYDPIAFFEDGYLFIGLGSTDSNNFVGTSEIHKYEYNAVSETLSFVRTYNLGRSAIGASVAVWNHQAFIVGLTDSPSSYSTATIVFDIETGQYKEFENLNNGRLYSSVVVLNDKLFVFSNCAAVYDAEEDIQKIGYVEYLDLMNPAGFHVIFEMPPFVYPSIVALSTKSSILFSAEKQFALGDPVSNSIAPNYVFNYEDTTVYHKVVDRSLDFASPGVLHMHGSGSTGPQTFLLNVLHSFEIASKLPLRATYRAGGASRGQRELLGSDWTGWQPQTHFTALDSPLNTEQFEEMVKHDVDIAQIPILLGAVGFYANIPNLGENDIVALDANMLTRLYTSNSRVSWGDLYQDMKDIVPSSQRNNIEWARTNNNRVRPLFRADPSDFTWHITNFLSLYSDDWDAEANREHEFECAQCTLDVSSASDMIDTLLANSNTIGYSNYEQASSTDLVPVYLAWGNQFMSIGTQEQYVEATQAAVEDANWPDSSIIFGDMSEVVITPTEANEEFDGWPMSSISYLLMRKDMTPMGDSGNLVKQLALYLYNEGAEVAADLGYSTIPTDIAENIIEGIESIVVAQPEFDRDGTADPFSLNFDFGVQGHWLRNSVEELRETAIESELALGECIDRLDAVEDEVLGADEYLRRGWGVFISLLLFALVGLNIYFLFKLNKSNPPVERGFHEHFDKMGGGESSIGAASSKQSGKEINLS
eukprot:maker-scaffold_48-snap-gene-0.35-mRNA-1 protein AED:0.09 eAED:0.09 QI:0/1/0.5/1/1/1/2/63/878